MGIFLNLRLQQEPKGFFDSSLVLVDDFQILLGEDEHKSRLLSWIFNPPKGSIPKGKTYHFYIYRSEGSKNLEYLDKVSGDSFEYQDTSENNHQCHL